MTEPVGAVVTSRLADLRHVCDQRSKIPAYKTYRSETAY